MAVKGKRDPHSHWLHWTPRDMQSIPSLKVSPMLGSSKSSSGEEVDLRLRIDCVRLVAALSLKMAVSEATNSFLGFVMVKKLGIREEEGWLPLDTNLSERLGLAPPISSDPPPVSGSSNPELHAKNVTPCWCLGVEVDDGWPVTSTVDSSALSSSFA